MASRERKKFGDFERGQRVVVKSHPDEPGTVVRLHGQNNPYVKGYVIISFDSDPERHAAYPWRDVIILPDDSVAKDGSILREAMPSWRGLVDTQVWTMAPGVVLLDKSGRTNTWETYVNGQQIGRERTIADAKAVIEARLGPCQWEALSTDRVEANHYYFGPTEEFTDPLRAYLGTPAELAASAALIDPWALS